MEEIRCPLRFGAFVLDPDNRLLTRDGETVELGSRYFDALELMVRHPRTLIAKDRFMDEVWQGIPVTDEALTQCIRTLRRALGDKASAPRFIETVPKHGYRFLAEVTMAGTAMSLPAPPATGSASPGARMAGATTLGGLLAGTVGGAAYALVVTSSGIAGFAVVTLLTMALALLGGAGIGTGMALAAQWRGRSDWAVAAGGAAGGALVGALGSVLAASGMEAITGTAPQGVTGMFEGLALGLAAGLSCVFAARLDHRGAWILSVAIGAVLAGATALVGGSFYGATLDTLSRAFPASDLDMTNLAAVFGEKQFGVRSRAVTAALEGALFTVAIVLANWRAFVREV